MRKSLTLGFSRFNNKLILAAAVAAVAALSAVPVARAGIVIWAGPGSSTSTTAWATATNWGTGGIPGTGNAAEFNTTFSNQPSIAGATSVQGLWLAEGVGQAVTITNTGQTLTIVGTATLNTLTNTGILLDDSGNHNLTIGTGTTAVTNTTSFRVNNAATLEIQGSLAITAGKVLTLTGNNASGNIIISGSTTNTTGAITINTPGTVTLSGNNLNSGTTTLTAGKLNINHAHALGTGTLSLNGGTVANITGSALTLSTSQNATLGGNVTFGNAADTGGNGDISFGGSLTYGSAPRIITLSGTNSTFTFAGSLIQNNNTVSGLTVNGAGNTLVFGGLTINSGGSGGGTITLLGDGNITINGAVINGNGGNSLKYNGTGVLILAGNGSTYTGTTTITTGTLQVGNGGATGNIPGGITNNSQLIFNHGANSYAQSTNITGTGAVTQTGAGALTLSGAANTFSGGLTIDTAGGSVIASGSGAGKIGSGTVTMANTTTLDLGGVSRTIGLLATSGSGTAVSITSSTTDTGLTLTISGTTTQTFAGVISDGVGTSPIALSKTGTGTQIFSANQSYTGGTTIAATGKLQLGNGGTTGSVVGAIVDNGALIFSHGANAFDQTANITGTGTVTQTGAGALSLSAAGNTFSGGLTIDTAGGSVIANDANSGVLGSGTVTLANTTTLDLNGANRTTGLLATSGSGTGASITNNATNASSILTISGTTTQTWAGVISDGAGTSTIALTKAGTGTQVINSANTYSGDTIMSAGILRLSGASLPSANSFTSFTGGIIELAGGDVNETLAASGAGNMSINGTTLGFGALGADRTLNLGSITWGTNFTASTAFQLGSTTSDHKIILSSDIGLNAGIRVISAIHGTSTDVDAEISGDISGNDAANRLLFQGGGKIVLSGNNTFNNANSTASLVFVKGGTTLIVSDLGSSNAVTSSSLGTWGSNARSGEVDLDSGILRYVGGAQTSSRIISIGTGIGSGTLGGSASPTGTIDASGTGALVLTSNIVARTQGTGGSMSLILSGTNTDLNTLQGVIPQAVALTTGGYNSLKKTGSGTWALAGVSTYWGGTTVRASAKSFPRYTLAQSRRIW